MHAFSLLLLVCTGGRKDVQAISLEKLSHCMSHSLVASQSAGRLLVVAQQGCLLSIKHSALDLINILVKTTPLVNKRFSVNSINLMFLPECH